MARTVRRLVQGPSLIWALAMAGGALLVCFAPVRAQGEPIAPGQEAAPNPTSVSISRTQLEELAMLYRGYRESSAYSDSLRALAASELDEIDRRLSEGDFSEGDVVALEVEGQVELTDTFRVSQEQTVVLPAIGNVSLHGVLRSELHDRIRQEIARMVRDPQVSAVPMIRLAVLGAVNTPGFYMIPAATPLADVLMTAGGPMATADPRNLRIERRGDLLMLPGPEDQRLTVGQLNLRSGDQLVMPAQSQPLWQRVQSNVMTVLPMATLVLTMYLQLSRQP